MKPLMGLALAYPEQPSLYDLEGVGLQLDQDTHQPVRGGRQRTVLLGRIPPGGARFPIEAPTGHLGLEGSRKGRDQRPKLMHCETGQIEHRCRAPP
jgi:hypothetical protein